MNAIKFYTITSVREDLARYLKKDTYANCLQDICSFFEGKSIETICSQPILLFNNQGIYYIKSRLPNSCLNTGRSGAYRLYYFVNLPQTSIYLVGFYPKAGKYGRSDLTHTEEKILIRKFNEESNAGKCIEHDISKNFKEIKKQ